MNTLTRHKLSVKHLQKANYITDDSINRKCTEPVMTQPRSQASAVFGCTKKVEGLVSFLMCVTSRVERT